MSADSEMKLLLQGILAVQVQILSELRDLHTVAPKLPGVAITTNTKQRVLDNLRNNIQGVVETLKRV